jgi:hypothetical protein
MWSWIIEPCPRWVKTVARSCSFAALRVTPAIWVSVHDPLRRIIAYSVVRLGFVSPNECVHVTEGGAW